MKTTTKIFVCPKCGDTDYLKHPVWCSCGGMYEPMPPHDAIAYEVARKSRILNGITHEENRYMHGTGILEPDPYREIPQETKERNDELRIRFGGKPRWRDET